MSDPVFTAGEAEAHTVKAPWGSLTWVASQAIGNVQDMTLGFVVIKKGESNPRHVHPNCEEVLYLLRGKLEHTLGDEKVVMGPGDTIAVPPGVFHNGINIGDEDAEMIVAYSEGAREFVLESDVAGS